MQSVCVIHTTGPRYLQAKCPSCHPPNSVKTQKLYDQINSRLQMIQLAQLSLTKPSDTLHHNKRQNFKTVT